MRNSKCLIYSFLTLLVGSILASCSSTRVIPDGQSRLVRNKVEISNSELYPASDILPYIRQRNNQWSPFIYVYNWSNGKDNWWDKAVKRVGQAPVIFDETLISSSIDNMLNHLIYIGYYDSKIEETVVTKKKKTTVNYNVTIGKQYHIKSIEYNIKNPILDSIYFSDTTAFLIRPGDILSENALDNESERAAALFRRNGYFGFSKNYFFFEADTLSFPDSAMLKISIENFTRNEVPDDNKADHTQYHIGNVTIYPVSDVIRYRASLLSPDILQLDTLRKDSVNFIYDQKLILRPNVISNVNRIEPGALYNEEIVNNTYQRLSNLRLFNSVNVEMSEGDSGYVDATIRMIPSKFQGYKLNLEASSSSLGLLGISPSISYYHRNIFKGGEWLNLSFMGNFQRSFKDTTKRSTEFGITASLSFPTFLFLPDRIFHKSLPRTDFSASYNYQERPDYTRNMISTSFGYSWNHRQQYFYQIYPIQINIVNLPYMKDGFLESLNNPFMKESYKAHFDLGMGGTFYYTTDPAISPKKSYFYTRFSFDIAGNLLSLFNNTLKKDTSGYYNIWGSPYSQYVRGEISTVYTAKFGKENKHSLATRLLFGIGNAYGNSTTLPLEKMFYGGGANSLRGWLAREVGPGSAPLDNSFSISNQTGEMRIEANVEYRFPLFWILNGATFIDIGNIWITPKNKERLDSSTELGVFKFNDFYKSLAANWGLGLRLDIGFVVIRLDMGLKIYEPTTQSFYDTEKWFGKGWLKNNSFHFGIGYPF